MGELRKPFLVAALVILVTAVLIEAGSAGIVSFIAEGETVGMAMRYMALLDGLLLFTLALLAAPLVLPEGFLAKSQGIVSLVVSFLSVLGAIVMIIVAFVLLMLMVGFLLAVPFGTIVYMARWADFSRGTAAATLATLMGLKIALAVCLLLAHQRFLQYKSLVLFILTSMLANIVIAFLHGIVPSFLASITDALAAIVVGILAAIWAIVMLIASLPSIVKALRVDQQLT